MDEKTIPARVGRRCRYVRDLILALAFVIVVSALGAHALPVVATRGPEAKALSMERSSFSLAFDTNDGGNEAIRWKLDAGEWTLFEIEGLSVGACAAEVRRGGWGGIFSAGVLSSPMGTESVLGGTVLAAGRGRVGLGAGVSLETVALDGCRKTVRLALSVDAVVRLSPLLTMCSRVGGITLAGSPLPGADARLSVAAFPARSLCGIVGISVSRSGVVVCDVSSRIRLGRSVRAALGYDDGAAQIDGSLTLKVRGLGFEAGASVHPVLGVSKALFVSWRRGLWE